jgi:membrane-associated protease RseP (regulator of RpoE activity)
MSGGNGNAPGHVEFLEREPIPAETYLPPPRPPQWKPYNTRRSLAIAAVLFVMTLMTSLATGAQFAAAFARNETFSGDDLFRFYGAIFTAPRLLLPGVPFALTLLGILLAHELGHWFACRKYGIVASYPYFIPAPTIIGTLGAFIRIRSPIRDRRALFDVGLSGPVVGFVLAVPALAIGLLNAKIIPGVQTGSQLLFGDPLLQRLLEHIVLPGVRVNDILLHPIGRAAWVGLFATALNLLPAGQLDGGHILYSVASKRHRYVTFGVALAMVPLYVFFKWQGWLLWSVLLLFLGFRHPPLIDRWHPLDRKRLIWAGIALLIFLLCFMPAPVLEAN